MRRKLLLGVEGGATKTDWVLISPSQDSSKVLKQGKLPSANLRIISDRSLRMLLGELPQNATHVGVFLAGCITTQDRIRLLHIVQKIWPSATVAVGNDRESSLAAAFRDRDGIVVICGTGAGVTGRRNGQIEKAGGRGHILGDKGGGYVLALDGIRLALETYDLMDRVTPLAERILNALALNRMEDLVGWIQAADKMSVSRLAPLMFQCAKDGDHRVEALIQSGANTLAGYTASVTRRLKWKAPTVRLLGGIFHHQPEYVLLFQAALRKIIPKAKIQLCADSGAMGAAWLASGKPDLQFPDSEVRSGDVVNLADSNTEQPNPRSTKLEEMGAQKLVDLFVDEEKYVAAALRSSRKRLANAVGLIVSQFKKGGRLFYVGAGSSGRLGVLDASEIPPTFGESPERVQAIIAGGYSAIHRSIEGAEDQEEEGALVILDRGVKAKDVVCGITASGRTPFVLGALQKAKAIGARTILITCNPERTVSGNWDIKIDLATGPELIAGSTRLKAATATKVALNILSTCTMIRLKRIHGNLMTHLVPSNAKLRDRAARLVSMIVGCPYDEAFRRLVKNGWNVHRAIHRSRKN